MIGLIQKLNQNMPRVLISDPLDSIASEILTKNNISVDAKTNLSPEEFKKIIDILGKIKKVMGRSVARCPGPRSPRI